MHVWVTEVPVVDSIGVELPGCVRSLDAVVKLLGEDLHVKDKLQE